MDFNRIVAGVIRAARLDKSFYNMVEHDTSYNQDALVVVIVSSLVGALGSFLSLLFNREIVAALLSFIFGALIAVGSYYLWAYVAQFVGTRFFHGTGDFGEVQRCLGFAYAPRLLNVLSVIPCLGAIAGLVAWIWSIVAGYVAIQEALDLDSTNALLTVVISAVIVFLIAAIITAIFGAIGIMGAAATGAFR